MPRTTIQEAFLEYHSENPQVYTELLRLSRRAMSNGKTKLGISMLWEVLRWNIVVESTIDVNSNFEFNNNYRSRYARLIMEQEADLKNFFEIRQLTSE